MEISYVKYNTLTIRDNIEQEQASLIDSTAYFLEMHIYKVTHNKKYTILYSAHRW